MMYDDDDDDHVLEDSDPDIDIIVREEVDMEDLDGEKVVDLEFIAKNILVCLPDTSNSVDVFAHTIENVANYPSFSNEPNEIVDIVSTAVDESDENLVVESDSDEDDEIKLKPMMADCLTAEEESSGPSGLPRTRNEIINRDDDIRLTEISACVANMPGLKIDRKGDIFVLRAEVGGISTYSSSFSEVGLVMNYVEHEKSVIVKSNTGQTNSLPLNEDSLVCIKPNRNGVNADFMVLGKVSEVFGPVTAPFYLVKLARSAPVEDSSDTSLGPVADHGRNQHTKPGTTRKHIRSRKNKGSNVVESTSTVVADVPSVPSPQQPVLSALEWIQGYSDDEDEDESAQPSSRDLSQSESLTTPASSTISKTADGGDEACVPWPGSLVFAVAGQCQYLTAAILMTMRVKGSDASNIYDEEPDDSEVEFSDDEKEMAAKLSRKNKGGTTLPPSAPLQQQRQQQHHHRRPQQPTYPHSQNSSRNLSVSHHPPFQPPLPPGPPPLFSMMMMPGPLPPPHPQFQQQFLPLHPSSQATATGYRTTAANIPKGLNDLTYTYKPIQYNFS